MAPAAPHTPIATQSVRLKLKPPSQEDRVLVLVSSVTTLAGRFRSAPAGATERADRGAPARGPVELDLLRSCLATSEKEPEILSEHRENSTHHRPLWVSCQHEAVTFGNGIHGKGGRWRFRAGPGRRWSAWRVRYQVLLLLGSTGVNRQILQLVVKT